MSVTEGEAAIGMGVDAEPTIHTSATSESGFDGGFDDGTTVSSSDNNTSTRSDNKHAGGSSAPFSSAHSSAARAGEGGGSSSSSRSSDQYVSGNHDNDHNNSARAPIGRASRNSLGSDTDGLVLFDLTTKTNEKRAFSPHCMKTILDLKLLNIGYDRQRLTFTQIRSTLSKRVSETVTVPTLELFNGSHLTDSWNIAQYLYTSHPQGSRLFPQGETSRSYARFIENYGKLTIATNLRPLTRSQLCGHLDDENQLYFEMEKVGKSKMDKFRNLNTQEKQRYIDATADALEPVQAALLVSGEKTSSPAGSPVWLEGLSHPTHADFALYGWYVYSRVSGRAVTREIWNTHSAVAKWVSDMNNWAGPDITGDFF